MNSIETQICTTCKRELPADTQHFFRGNNKSGLNYKCKECCGYKFGVYRNIYKGKENSGYKICTKCKRELPATKEYFQIRHKKGKEYLEYWCKDCMHKKSKEWRDENKEHIKQYSKEYNQKYYDENRIRILARVKKYRVKNRIKIKAYRDGRNEHFKKLRKKYYEEHREYYFKKHHEWVKNNPEKNKLIDLRKRHKRRMLKKTLPINYAVENWETCKKYFENKCAYCGRELPLTQDHFIAISKGGEYTINNIIPACRNCNSRKNSKDFFIWYPKYEYYSKKREQKILKYLGYKGQAQQLSIIPNGGV